MRHANEAKFSPIVCFLRMLGNPQSSDFSLSKPLFARRYNYSVNISVSNFHQFRIYSSISLEVKIFAKHKMVIDRNGPIVE